MSKESNKNTPEITPQELATKMEALVDKVKELAATSSHENQWARDTALFHSELNADEPNYYEKDGITIPISKVEELCHELYEIIMRGVEQENNATDLYRKASPLTDVTINQNYNNISSSHGYNENKKKKYFFSIINFSIPAVKNNQTISELAAPIAHERGHHRQKVGFEIAHELINPTEAELYKNPILPEPTSSDVKEYKADQGSGSRVMLAFLLQIIIDNPSSYKDNDQSITHPSYRNRREILLKRMFVDDEFKMNNTWEEKVGGGHRFQPRNHDSSYPITQSKVDEKINLKNHHKKPLTENGNVVNNYPRIAKLAQKEIDSLMSKFDDFVKYDFNLNKKNLFLDVVDEKVAAFKEKHKLEFIEAKGFLELAWKERMMTTPTSQSPSH